MKMIQTMSAMMEAMSAPSVRHLAPPKPSESIGVASEIYAQMRRDFMVASPFVLHGSVPELLAAAWAVVRETLLCGDALRSDKEVIAVAVSEQNLCPYCVGVHRAATADATAVAESLEAWGRCTSTANAPALSSHHHDAKLRAEYYGTAVAFHYLNRVVSVFLSDKMLPLPDVMDGVGKRIASVMMRGMVDKGRRNRPGDSTNVLPAYDGALAWNPHWADARSNVRAALRAWSGIIEGVAVKRLDERLLQPLRDFVDGWRGEVDERAMARAVDASVNPAAAELALTTVLTPWEVDASMVRAVHDTGLSQDSVLVLVSWAAHRAARRVGEWIDG